MKGFVAGLILGIVVATLAPVMAGSNPFNQGQSDKVREYDYFRQRQMQLDIAAMRRAQEKAAADRAVGLEPCTR